MCARAVSIPFLRGRGEGALVGNCVLLYGNGKSAAPEPPISSLFPSLYASHIHTHRAYKRESRERRQWSVGVGISSIEDGREVSVGAKLCCWRGEVAIHRGGESVVKRILTKQNPSVVRAGSDIRRNTRMHENPAHKRRRIRRRIYIYRRRTKYQREAIKT